MGWECIGREEPRNLGIEVGLSDVGLCAPRCLSFFAAAIVDRLFLEFGRDVCAAIGTVQKLEERLIHRAFALWSETVAKFKDRLNLIVHAFGQDRFVNAFINVTFEAEMTVIDRILENV